MERKETNRNEGLWSGLAFLMMIFRRKWSKEERRRSKIREDETRRRIHLREAGGDEGVPPPSPASPPRATLKIIIVFAICFLQQHLIYHIDVSYNSVLSLDVLNLSYFPDLDNWTVNKFKIHIIMPSKCGTEYISRDSSSIGLHRFSTI